MIKKLLSILFISFVILCASSSNVLEAQTQVQVALPNFDVYLNEVKLDNKNLQYPLIVYKNITYFPLTYYDSRFMGIETKWNEITGLKINLSDKVFPYVRMSSQQNKKIYIASIPTFNVEINNKVIDNKTEEYPLLEFRNVTYFPLTWRFAVQEFGWEYSFNSIEGLKISSDKYNRPEVVEVDLPVSKRDPMEIAFTATEKYFYYESSDGKIYQQSISNPNDKKPIYNLPIWTYGDSYVYPSLDTVDNIAILSYHQGGGAMGTDYVIKLFDDGSFEEYDTGYSYKKTFGDMDVRVNFWTPPSKNNLTIKKGDESSDGYKIIGDPKYYYGWICTSNEITRSFSRSSDLYLIGEDIYIIASDEDNDTFEIYKVNINNNLTTAITNETAKKFIIKENIIYFMNKDGYLFKMSIEGGVEEKLTDFSVTDFTILGEDIYYTIETPNKVKIEDSYEKTISQLFKLGSSKPLNAGINLNMSLAENYLISTCLNNEMKYNVIIIDSLGNAIYNSFEEFDSIKVNNNKVYLLKIR